MRVSVNAKLTSAPSLAGRASVSDWLARSVHLYFTEPLLGAVNFNTWMRAMEDYWGKL